MAMLAWSATPAYRAGHGPLVRAGPRRAGPRIAQLNWGNSRSSRNAVSVAAVLAGDSATAAPCWAVSRSGWRTLLMCHSCDLCPFWPHDAKLTADVPLT